MLAFLVGEMSLNQIEELTAALVKAEQGELSDKEFQIVVLRSLISLKESHVSVRSRLYNVEKFKMLVKVVRYFTEGNLNQHKSRKAELLYCTLCNIRNIDGNILGMLDTIHIIHLLYNYNIHYVYNVYIVHNTHCTR